MMQPQGLGALMPQGAQQAPQMNNPRLNAAVDVVSSDAEKQILDPRTLAMLKYKDALQAMQAADQMMAAAQPQPMPPTVAERTKLAAEQGIAGLASRLSPGIQRQGGNMQAQQLQQAVSGGLPQLPAPNMAGMAGGGIVAFQEGGRPEDKFHFTDEFGNPVYESDLARTMNAEAVDDTPEGAERRAQYEALQREGVNLRDLAQTPARQEPRDRTSAPSTTYDTGDRTGQGENLRGTAEGIASLVGDRVRGAVPSMSGMSEKELTALTTSEGGGAEGVQGEGSFVRDLLRSIGGNREEDRGPRSGSGGLPDISVGGTARDIGTLARSVVDASALPFAAYEKAGQYGPNISEIASAVAAGYRGEEAPEVPGMFDRRPEAQAQPETQVATQTPTAAQGQAVGTPRVRPAQQGFTPAPESMSGEMREPTPVERLRAAAAENTAQQGGRDAVDAVLEAEAEPRAGESASDRAARMRRLIAGLRGFGAEGLGGFAAGSAEEELRAEQEQIADKERQRRAAMETRGLDLEERGLTQRDEILRMEIANQQREAQEMMDLRYAQLAATHGAAVADAIAAQTSFLVPRIIELRTVLADPSYERGFFGKRDELEAELAKQEAVLSATEAEVYALYGPAPTSSPRVSGGAGGGYESVSNEDLLRSLGGN